MLMVLRLHLALAFLYQHHHLDHRAKASAIQWQVHRGELGRRAVEAEGMRVLFSSRKTSRPTFPKAKIVLYNYFLTVFMGDTLKSKHISIKLSYIISLTYMMQKLLTVKSENNLKFQKPSNFGYFAIQVIVSIRAKTTSTKYFFYWVN